MTEDQLRYLVCPNCADKLTLISIDKLTKSKSIEAGLLQCDRCSTTYEIANHIPRFVPKENYASGFGFQWSKHANTQHDSYSGTKISENRFFEETKWSRDLRSETILEVGSGAGRFTEQAVSTGAMVVSMDYSEAVDVNYHGNGDKDNLLIVQGDIYAMPFPVDFFDKVLCIGVLQHTPDVEKAFLCLPKYIKPGGSLVIDVYRRRWWTYLLLTQRWMRPLTKRLAPETLYRLVVK